SMLKTRLEVKGNRMYDALQRELHFPFRRCGIVVAAFTAEEMKGVERLHAQGIENRVPGIELCSRSRLFALEPKLNPEVVGGLYAPTGGIVDPYRLVFSLVESAVKNGVVLKTGFEVVEAFPEGADPVSYRIESTSGETLRADWVVNAAGLYADEVSRIFGAEDFRIVPRKGEEVLLERGAAGHTDRIIFPVPSARSKGTLVIPTVEGTTMIGPTVEAAEEKEDFGTTDVGFQKVFDSARQLVPAVSEKNVITAFSGVRPTLPGEDFYIDLSRKASHLVQVAGIQSPGLTAAPALAEYVAELLRRAGLRLIEKAEYDPEVTEVKRLRNATLSEIDLLVSADPDYGEVVCQCETVSAAEIKAAVQRGHTTLDGIKFYTRAGMGRCQGGFCTYKTAGILAREKGLA
ncbi:FAD-dependent oxidoreductase, partial [Salinispira pacifica]